MVSFVNNSNLVFGLLREKPFQTEAAILLKDQALRRLKFKVKAGIWCVKIDLLDRLQGTSLHQFNYVLGANECDNGIVVPVYELLTPITAWNENALNNYYDCYDFIKYTFHDTHANTGQRSVHMNNYSINRLCVTRLYQIAGINRND